MENPQPDKSMENPQLDLHEVPNLEDVGSSSIGRKHKLKFAKTRQRNARKRKQHPSSTTKLCVRVGANLELLSEKLTDMEQESSSLQDDIDRINQQLQYSFSEIEDKDDELENLEGIISFYPANVLLILPPIMTMEAGLLVRTKAIHLLTLILKDHVIEYPTPNFFFKWERIIKSILQKIGECLQFDDCSLVEIKFHQEVITLCYTLLDIDGREFLLHPVTSDQIHFFALIFKILSFMLDAEDSTYNTVIEFHMAWKFLIIEILILVKRMMSETYSLDITNAMGTLQPMLLLNIRTRLRAITVGPDNYPMNSVINLAKEFLQTHF